MNTIFKTVQQEKELSLSEKVANQISDLNWIFWGCTGLRRLDLSGNEISNLQGLMNLPKLNTLDVSANQISDLIKERNIGIGDKLPNEFELAESLNVGRGTIREAVKLLVARNCLEIRRGKGTFVTEELGKVDDPLGFDFITDKIGLTENLYEVRMHMEPWPPATWTPR